MYTRERERERLMKLREKAIQRMDIKKKNKNRKKETEYKTVSAIPPLISGSNYVTVTTYLRRFKKNL